MEEGARGIKGLGQGGGGGGLTLIEFIGKPRFVKCGHNRVLIHAFLLFSVLHIRGPKGILVTFDLNEAFSVCTC